MFREQPTPNADDKIANFDIAGKSVAGTMQNYDNVAGGLDKKIRKNAVHAIEFFVGANSEFFEGLPDEKKLDYLKDSLMYIAKKHGAENVIAASIHLDEKTPHLTAIVMPVAIDKKGRKGLSAKAFYGGSKHKMREVQDDFHAKVAKKHGLGRGEVGSEAVHKPAKQMRNEMKKALAAAEKREAEATTILSKTRDHVKRLEGVETNVRSGFYENVIKNWKAMEQKIVFDTPKPAWGEFAKEYRKRIVGRAEEFQKFMREVVRDGTKIMDRMLWAIEKNNPHLDTQHKREKQAELEKAALKSMAQKEAAQKKEEERLEREAAKLEQKKKKEQEEDEKRRRRLYLTEKARAKKQKQREKDRGMGR